MVKPFLVHCPPQQRLGLHVLLGNAPSGKQVAAKGLLLKKIVNFLNLALENFPEAVAAALEDTPSGTIFVMRNVTVVLDATCVDIPPFKSLRVCSEGQQRRRIRFYDPVLPWTSSLRWLRDFLDKICEPHAVQVRAVFGLSENAVVRFQNVIVECCTPTPTVNQLKSNLYLGCTWAGHHQSSVEIQEDDLGQGIAGTSFVVMLGALKKNSCMCGKCEPQWFTAGWICPVVFQEQVR